MTLLAETRVPERERVPWSWLVALAALQFTLALSIAPPGMGEGDAAEFTLTLALAGVPHPPGYPLYTLFGHAFVRASHALGASWAFAAVLWSAAAAALATLLTAALCDALIPAELALDRRTRMLLVSAAAVLLAANPVFMRAATQAEVYAVHTAWVAGCALAGLALWRSRARLTVAHGLGFGALLGVGLAHHLTAVFFVLPVAAVVSYGAWHSARRVPAFALGVGLGAIVPLSAYGFILWRAFHPATFQWPALEASVPGVFAHITAAIYHRYVGGFAPSEAEARLLLAGVAPLVVPGVFTLVWFAWRARRADDSPFLWALLAAVVMQLVFQLGYGIEDPSAGFLPIMVVSLALLVRAAASFTAVRGHRSPALALILVGVAVLATTWVARERDHARRVGEVGASVRAAFVALPFERGIVVWQSDAHVRLLAHQLLDGEQTGLVVIDPAMLTWPRHRAATTRTLGFDPLAGLRLESDADLSQIAPNIARQTRLPVVDFAAWWQRSQTP